MRHQRKKYDREDRVEDAYTFGEEPLCRTIPHPYYRREVVMAMSCGRDVQTKMTWWCDYYASV